MPPIDSRYAIVAEKPASSSYGAVPGLEPCGRPAPTGAGRALYGRHDSSSSCRPYATPRCGPQNLYARAMKTSQPSACTSTGSCAAYCTASTQQSAPASCASSDDARDVDDRADRVRRGDARDDAHALVELPLEVVEVEAQVVGDVDPVDLEAAVGGELDPRRDAAVVVEARDEDPVALLPVARRRAREREVERRHVRAEDDVVGRAAEEAAGVVARRSRGSPRRACSSRSSRRCSRDASRSARAIASPTSSGTCEPPGASRKTKPPSAARRSARRTASTSSSVVLMERAYLGGPGSASPASSSAAATSAASARRPRSSARARPRRRRSRSWTPPGRRASRRSTPPTRTAAGAARRASASGCGRRARTCATRSSSRRRRSTRWTRARTTASRRRACKRQIETSLRRLGVERVDLYLTHAWDPDVPIAETRRRLRRARRRREDRRVRREQRRRRAARARRSPPAPSPGCRTRTRCSTARPSSEVLPLCAEHGLGFTPFSPLAGGWLTGKYRRGEAAPAGSRMTHAPEPYEHLPRRRASTTRSRLALRRRARDDPATLALAWLLADPRVTRSSSARAARTSSSRRSRLCPSVSATAERDALAGALRDHVVEERGRGRRRSARPGCTRRRTAASCACRSRRPSARTAARTSAPGSSTQPVTGPIMTMIAASARPITMPATACGERRSIAPRTTKTRIPAASASASNAEPQLVTAWSKWTPPRSRSRAPSRGRRRRPRSGTRRRRRRSAVRRCTTGTSRHGNLRVAASAIADRRIDVQPEILPIA